MVVRKITASSDSQLVIGALTAGGTIYLNKPLIDSMGLSVDAITPTIETEKAVVNRLEELYSASHIHLELKDKTIIIVDDGFASGATLRVSMMSARNMGAKKIIVAFPVMPVESAHALKNSVDELVCLYPTDVFVQIGDFYESFNVATDDEIIDALK
jgi:predicted phosphoribosyltransferase